MLATLDDVQQRFNVKTDRVSLGGFSGGGIGTWIFGPRYPDRFSALVPRAGIPPKAEEIVKNLNGLPIFVIHGDRDGTIPVANSRSIVKELGRLGIPHRYEERHGGHEVFSELNDEVLGWLARKRRTLRSSFRYHGPVDGRPRIIHWVQVEGRGTVTVTANVQARRKLVLKLETTGHVDRLVLWVTRKLVDMGRRNVDVVINGRAMGFPLAESVAAVLDGYAITRDLRRVFTARVVVDGSRIR